jgi:hypothetical protein
MKKKSNIKQFGGFSMPRVNAPVQYKYKPMGLEGFREPLGELQSNINLARERMDDVDFTIETTGVPADKARAQELQGELEGNVGRIQEVFNKTNDYSFVTRELKKQNKFYNKDKEIQGLRGNAQLKANFENNLWEANKKDPEKWPSFWVQAVVHDRNREYAKEGYNYNPETGRGNTYNDQGPQEYLEKEIQDLAIKLADMDPADRKGWVAVNGSSAQKNIWDQVQDNEIFVEEKSGSITAQNIANIFRTSERYKNWAKEEGRMMHNVNRDSQQNAERFDSDIIEDRINEYNEQYNELSQQDGYAEQAAQLAEVIDSYYDVAVNGSPEDKENLARQISQYKNIENRLGRPYLDAYGEHQAYLWTNTKKRGDGSGGNLKGIPVPKAQDVKIQATIAPIVVGAATTEEEIDERAISGQRGSTVGPDLIERVTSKDNFQVQSESQLIQDTRPSVVTAQEVIGLDSRISDLNTQLKQETDRNKKQTIFKELLNATQDREDLGDYLKNEIPESLYNDISAIDPGNDFLTGLTSLYNTYGGELDDIVTLPENLHNEGQVAYDEAVKLDQIDRSNFPQTAPILDPVTGQPISGGGGVPTGDQVIGSFEDYKAEEIRKAEDKILENSNFKLLKDLGQNLLKLKEKSAVEQLKIVPLDEVFRAANIDKSTANYVKGVEQYMKDSSGEYFDSSLYNMDFINISGIDSQNPSEPGAPIAIRVNRKDKDIEKKAGAYAIQTLKQQYPGVDEEVLRNSNFEDSEPGGFWSGSYTGQAVSAAWDALFPSAESRKAAQEEFNKQKQGSTYDRIKAAYILENPATKEIKMDASTIGSDNVFEGLAKQAQLTQKAISQKFSNRVKGNYSEYADPQTQFEEDLTTLDAQYENLSNMMMLNKDIRQSYIQLQSSLIEMRDQNKGAGEAFVTQQTSIFKPTNEGYIGYEIEWNYDADKGSFYFTPIKNVYDKNYNIIHSKTDVQAPQFIGGKIEPMAIMKVDSMYGTGSMENIQTGFFKNDFVPLIFMERGDYVAGEYVDKRMK